jgi:hypothetical protein
VILREYNRETDREAVLRIWREVGWIEDDKQEEIADTFIAGCRGFVAEVDGSVECFVNTTPATVRYLDRDLTLAAVAGVTTSRVARKQGLASQLTARAVAADAADGALVAGLGVFEQGFYNQLGFGSGGYEHWISFDPAQLRIEVSPRIPRRVTADDWAAVHASRLARLRGHGACNLLPPEITKAEMMWVKNGFGLCYCDGPQGELTHHVWCKAEGQHGPYSVYWMSYQTMGQFLELMALLRNLGDQVRLIKMCEPQGIQLQDMLQQPFKHRQMTEKSKFEGRMHASAYWQMRICDLPGCLERTHLRCDELRFNLKLADPIERYLDDNTPWRGVSGDYVVTLGPSSGAEPGVDDDLPMLTASVGAFTRLWLGVRPATGLAVTDELAGPSELLEQLDWALLLPAPKPDWDF